MINNTNNLTDIINETSPLTNTTVSDSSSGLTTSEKIANLNLHISVFNKSI